MNPAVEISMEQFVKIRDLIYKKLGLFFEDKKLYFIRKRVEKRLESLNIDDPNDYVFLLRFNDADNVEMQQLANLVTTNETYMFREYEQLEAFANCCLPEVLDIKRARNEKTIRVWCAGCSSGEEAYSLAIILSEVLSNPEEWKVEIQATDIDEEVLGMARRGHYEERSMRFVPEEYLGRHFTKGLAGYSINPGTSRLVKFDHLNLNDRFSMRSMKSFDFIFCRNVLIYFDDLSRKTVVDHFYNSLNNGGYIFLGHSESIGRITSAFKLKRADNFLVYTKE